MQIDYKLSPALEKSADSRIAELREKKTTIDKFVQALKAEDRYYIRDGVLDEWTPERHNEEVDRVTGYIKTSFEKTMGIQPDTLVANGAKFEQVFPGIGPVIDKIKAEAEKENCKGCALRKKSDPIYDFMQKNKAGLTEEKLAPIKELLSPDAYNLLSGKAIDYKEMAKTRVPRVVMSGPPPPAQGAKPPDKPGVTENPDKQLRPGCTDCVRKHLAQAVILLNEVMTGYSEDPHVHRWLALGHLAEAGDEALKDNQQLAERIRQIRLDLMNEVKK